MMASNGIGEKMSKDVLAPDGMLRTSRRVVNSFRNFIAVDVCFRTEITLPCWRELSDIMPEPCDITPLTCGFCLPCTLAKHLFCEFCRPPGDLVQMTMIPIKTLTSFASLATKRWTIRREKRLPL